MLNDSGEAAQSRRNGCAISAVAVRNLGRNTHNNYEIHMCRGKELAAHMRCSYVNEDVVIKDLFVIKKYRGIGLEEVLLTKAMTYAAKKNANQIVTYCGAEPFCKDGQIPLEQEVSWYKNHGFFLHHKVMDVTPCMVMKL